MKKNTFRRSLGLAGAALMLTGCLIMRPLTASAVTVKEGSTAVVTADKLFIRSGPGTNYAIRGSLTNGYKVEVLEVSGNWARTSDGWLSTDYLSISGAAGVTTGSKVRVTADYLNIRQGAGTGYARVGRLTRGTQVEILDVKDGWGKMKDGWISLQYVTTVGGGSGSSSGTSSGSNASFAQGDTVYISADRLNIRSGPGTNYNTSGVLSNGTRVYLLETRDGWGRIDTGWISLDYLRSAPGSSVPSGTVPSGSTQSSGSYVTKGTTVRVTSNQLNIRKGPGTGYNKVGTLYNGNTAEVLEVQGSWGRINQGWICLDYTTGLTAASSSNSYRNISTGSRVQVTADSLQIRKGPGANYTAIGALSNGYRATILDVQNGWGKIDTGWISLDYVRIV